MPSFCDSFPGSFPGSAWERTVLEAPPPASRLLAAHQASAGGACNALGSQAEPGNQMQCIYNALFDRRDQLKFVLDV